MPDRPRKIEIEGEDEAPETDEQPVEEPQEASMDDADTPVDDPTDGDQGSTVEELQAEVQRLEQALEEEHDRHLRAVAELQNYRRRMSREQQEKQKYAGQSVVSAILPVMDNLRRILEHQAEAGTDDFAKGVEMTVDEFFRVLSQFGVTVIDCKGEQFDPDMHEAVARVDAEDVPEGTVVEVDTPGYCLHDRCIRPARVVVAAEGPAEDADSD